MSKLLFDIIFILIAGIILVFLNEYGLMDKYMGLSLIPILIAYSLGQYSQRRFGKSEKEEE